MFNQCNVVMLPTNKKAHLGTIYRRNNYKLVPKIDTNDEIGTLFVNKNENVSHSNIDFTAHHLYITSDNKMIEGDYGLSKLNEIVKINKRYQLSFYKKIVATTDTSLMKESTLAGEKVLLPLPLIPSEFINTYVDEYNKGNEIATVLVEYEYRHDESVFYAKTLDGKAILKLNLDNTINIKSTKDSWSRQEVIDLIHKALSDFDNQYDDSKKLGLIDLWINKNV